MENTSEYIRDMDALRFTSRQKARMLEKLKSSSEEGIHHAPNPAARAAEPETRAAEAIKTGRNRAVKKRFPVALAAVIAALGVTAAAAAYFIQWDGRLAQRFAASERQQSELSQNGAVADVSETVTKNGVTISAIQTLGDKRGVYVLFDIKAPEGVKLTKDGSGMGIDVKIEGVDHAGWSAQFMTGGENPSSTSGETNERYYELWLDNSRGENWNGKRITVEFSDLRDLNIASGDNVVVSGKWKMSWELSYTDDMKTFDINKAYTVNGREVVVKSVQISPLSMSVELGGSGLDKLIANSDLYEAGGLCSVSLVKKDGTAVYAGPRSERCDGGAYTQDIRFEQIQTPDEITGFVLTFYNETKDNTASVTLP